MASELNQETLDSRVQKQLLEQGRRIRALHEIISRPDLTFDEQIDETLKLGCRILGTEIGKVGRQDPEHNASEFLNTIVTSELPAKRGMVLPLDKTFCQVTFSSPSTIAISHVEKSEYSDHPAAEFLGMQSYIGCSINVFGKKFGTVNFSNRKPVEHEFTEEDKDFVNLIGSWISVMMERKLEAEELRKAKEIAEQASSAKSNFLAHMSHEIRTPLTSIIGFADAVLDNQQTPEEREAALKVIRRSSEHLLNLVNDVLDISKIEAGELSLNLADVNIDETINDINSFLTGQASDKGLKFETELCYPYPKTLHTDPLRLKQILLNLCNNAIKFTHKGSIKLYLQYDEENSTINFNVIDTGIGMNEEQLQYVFSPYAQAENSTYTRFGGTGLGLSLSRQLAEKMGGNLLAVSSLDEGSTFTLTLPVSDSDKNLQNMISQKQHMNKKQRTGSGETPKLHGHVLLADDSELNHHLFRTYLEIAGLSVDIVENGELAVEYASKNNYDLVLMDMVMPVMDGVTAVKIIRELGYEIPIIMLTANVTTTDRELCIDAGSNYFLSKPINKQQFYDTLEKCLPDTTKTDND